MILVKPLVQSRFRQHQRSRRRAPNANPASNPHPVIDAATLASTLQLQEQRREILCSFLALGMKLGLVSLGCVSLVKLSFAYQERLDRHGEIAAVVDVESAKLHTLQKRFDRLFTLGGDRRLMDEQVQWITPNRLRVIWR